MADLLTIHRALISVSDKDGLIPLASALHARGIELISTGGTARALREAGLPVTSVDSITGFPEILGGRVKTLHPSIHGGLLARKDDPDHTRALHTHSIEHIDLLIVNLYPFEQTIATPGVSIVEAVENIDVGGPTMIRAAAKNHESVCVAVEPAQYQIILHELATAGGISVQTRRTFAATAFGRTAAYDAAIASHLRKAFLPDELLPERLTIGLTRAAPLRYGENPHQRAAVYRAPSGPLAASPSLVDARQLHGKELSYNNLLDGAAALATVRDVSRAAPGRPCASIVKHTNPCGAASARTLADAVDLALAGDPVASYGGILATSTPVDRASAERLTRPGLFLEVIIAPDFDADALELLRSRWVNVRLLAMGDAQASAPSLTVRSIPGGALVQEPDSGAIDTSAWTIAAGPPIDTTRRAECAIIWAIAKNLTSNAIAIGGADGAGVRLFGAGAGQMDRVASCRIAIEKAGPAARGAIAASDAFFPFSDGPALLIDAGVAVLIHPGGSKRDDETFALCAKHGVSCVVTGTRHFRH